MVKVKIAVFFAQPMGTTDNNPPARHTQKLPQHQFMVWNMLNNMVAEHFLKGAISERQVRGVGFDKVAGYFSV